MYTSNSYRHVDFLVNYCEYTCIDNNESDFPPDDRTVSRYSFSSLGVAMSSGPTTVETTEAPLKTVLVRLN